VVVMAITLRSARIHIACWVIGDNRCWTQCLFQSVYWYSNYKTLGSAYRDAGSFAY
jgi:hypothetical protein